MKSRAGIQEPVLDITIFYWNLMIFIMFGSVHSSLTPTFFHMLSTVNNNPVKER